MGGQIASTMLGHHLDRTYPMNVPYKTKWKIQQNAVYWEKGTLAKHFKRQHTMRRDVSGKFGQSGLTWIASSLKSESHDQKETESKLVMISYEFSDVHTLLETTCVTLKLFMTLRRTN